MMAWKILDEKKHADIGIINIHYTESRQNPVFQYSVCTKLAFRKLVTGFWIRPRCLYHNTNVIIVSDVKENIKNMTKHAPSIWHENLKMPENNLAPKFYSQTSCRVNDLWIYNLGFFTEMVYHL